MKLFAPAIALAAVMAFGSAQPSFAQTKTMEVSLGSATVLTDAKGMTLYIFVRDEPGKSNCTGGCAGAWPPLRVDAGVAPAENFSIIVRIDGTKQWAYKDKPLYLWSRDEKPGDTEANVRRRPNAIEDLLLGRSRRLQMFGTLH